jgi:hypothetical protein
VTRVLYWNILSCGTNSLFPPVTGKRARLGDDDPDYGVPAAPEDASARKVIFDNVVAAVNPDIIAVVEMIPGPGAAFEGSTLNDPTAFYLLLRLRRNQNAAFRLVPPLVSGTGRRSEGIAVYYRQDRLAFLGPFGWGGAGADTIANLGGAAGLATYPGVWGTARTRCLPNRDLHAFVGIANWLPPHTNENTLAGQWSYQAGGGGGPALFPAAGFRRPFLTAFADISGPVTRLVKLMAVHAPPQQRRPPGANLPARELAGTANPRAAVGTIAALQEIAGAMGPNEVRCIVGDFNISAWDATSDPTSFQLLRNAGYLQHLNPLALIPPAPPPPAVPATWPSRGYYATHTKSARDSDPWVSFGAGPTLRGYPGFGYVSSEQTPGNWYDAIDHVFTRYTGPDASANFTIVNPVTGSPFNADPAPPLNVVHGHIACGSQLNAPGLFGFPPGITQHAFAGANALIAFRNWQNYGKLRSLTDHMPLAIDI